MEPIILTAAHWVYALFVILVFVSIAIKVDTAVVAVLGMFILGWITWVPLSRDLSYFQWDYQAESS